jgi:TonB-dependent starch-binding outer membrane protein SusC
LISQSAIGVRLETNFNWNVDFNGSHYTNEIVRIDGEQDFFIGPVGGRGGTTVINQLGNPIGSFYGYQVDGIFQNQAEVDAHAQQDGAAPGRFRFRDVNGDGQITAADRTIIGDPHPDFLAGLNLGFQWRNLDFNTFSVRIISATISSTCRKSSMYSDCLTPMFAGMFLPIPGNLIIRERRYPRLDQNDEFSPAIQQFLC